MFTGIIEEVGQIQRISKGAQSARLQVGGKKIFSDLILGDSVAVNGVCLTVAALGKDHFQADVMNETLRRTNLAGLGSGSLVNLERAMAANGRFGGHIVAGHIDGIGKITALGREDNALWYTITAEATLLRYIIPKGSIAIDGISLTVAHLGKDSFQVSVIPHTAKETILVSKRLGDTVNLENDLIGKYVERLLGLDEVKPGQQRGGITRDFLTRAGY